MILLDRDLVPFPARSRFDRYATLIASPLTTIHHPCRELAEVAYRAMTERIAEPTGPQRTISVTPTLIVRESCGAYPRRSAGPARMNG